MVNTTNSPLPQIISFTEMEERCNELEGLVFIDASTREEPWEKTLAMIEKEGIAKASDFQEPFLIQTTGGRKDLIVFYNNENTIDFEKLATLRMEIAKHKEIGRTVVPKSMNE